MPGTKLLTEIDEFIRQAEVAGDPKKAKSCVDDGLARVQACGLSENSAIEELKSVITQLLPNKDRITSPGLAPNLSRVLAELDRRRKKSL